MGKIWEKKTDNEDGTYTESVKYSDGSGHENTYKEGGTFEFDKLIESKTYPAKD